MVVIYGCHVVIVCDVIAVVMVAVFVLVTMVTVSMAAARVLQ